LKIIPADLEAVHGIPLFNPISHAFNLYANYCRRFDAELEPVYDSPTILVIGVNQLPLVSCQWRGL